MKVTFKVKRGKLLVTETEHYPDLESTARGIQERVQDPFSPQVAEVTEIRDQKGRSYDIEWAAVLVPKAA